MSNQVNAKAGLSVKDLVTTGIFTALLFVFIMVGGVFFATNPMLTFFMPAGSALLAGPVYLLMIAKVHKRWSITIMGVIMAIIWFVTGMHCPISFSPWAEQDRTLFSSLIPRAGHRPCWEMEPSKAISTPCRRPQTRESLSPCLPLSL